MSYSNPPPNSNLILQNNHPLIERKDNYSLDRKLLTIHSQDRDITKWKYANHFEINCPQTYNNIQSMRLVEINFPCNYYNFSDNLQNNKFIIDISGTQHTITIPDGYYTDVQLASTLEFLLNNEHPPPASTQQWAVIYHETKQKILFANNFGAPFTLINDQDLSYNSLNNCNNIINLGVSVKKYNRYNKFNFLSYIGFTKKKTL